MADLSILVPQEIERASDLTYGAARNTQTDRASGNFESLLKLADTLTLARDLDASLTEAIRVRDFVYGAARNTQTDRASGNREDVVHPSDADLTARLTFYEITIVEGERVMDTVYGAVVGPPTDLSVGLQDAVDGTDTPGAQVDRLQVSLTETLRVRDFVLGAARFVASQNTQTAGLMENPLHLTEALTVVNIPQLLVVIPAEGLRVRDFVFGAARFIATEATQTAGLLENPLHLGDSGRIDLIGLGNPVKISDSDLTAEMDYHAHGLSAERAELGDFVYGASIGTATHLAAGLQDVVRIGEIPPLATRPVELEPEGVKVADSGGINLLDQPQLHIADGPPVASLQTGAGDLSPSLLTETVKVADAVLGPQLDPLIRQATDEALKVVDGAPTGVLDPLIRQVTDESLKVADGTPVGVLDPLVRQVTDETLHAADGPTTQQLDPLIVLVAGEALKIVDTVTPQLDPLLRLVTDEAAKVADTVLAPTLDPEQATAPAEAVKVQDTATAGIFLSGLPANENLHVVDTVLGPTLDPEQASVTESVRLQDTVTVPSSTLAATLSESCRVLDLNYGVVQLIGVIHVQDAVTAVVGQTNLSVLRTETLRLSDRVVNLSANVASETVRASDIGKGRASLLGVLHVVDGPPQVQMGGFLSPSTITETLKVGDAVTAIRDPLELAGGALAEVMKLGYDFNEVEFTRDEYATLTEVLFVDLTTPTNLSSGVSAETLRVGDPVGVARTLELAVAVEAGKLADALTMARDLTASLAENGSPADSLTAVRELTASVAEALQIAESEAGYLDPLQQQQAATEAARLSDGQPVAVSVGDALAAGLTNERAVLADTVAASSGLIVTLSEAVSLAEVFDAGFGQPLDAALTSEALTPVDVALLTVTVTPITGMVADEALRLQDATTATPAIVVVVASEQVRQADNDLLQLGMDLSVELPGPPIVPMDAIAIVHDALSDPMFADETLSDPMFADELLRA